LAARETPICGYCTTRTEAGLPLDSGKKQARRYGGAAVGARRMDPRPGMGCLAMAPPPTSCPLKT